MNEIQNIKSIAETNSVPWGTLAGAIDQNFAVIAENKADIDAYDNLMLSVNLKIISLESSISDNVDDLSARINATASKIPTKVSQLTNDSKYFESEEYTYAQLVLLADSNSLNPGNNYILTDYDCIYLHNDTVVTNYNKGWKLVLTANSTYDFNSDIYITYDSDSEYALNGGIPITACKYRLRRIAELNQIYYSMEDVTSKGYIYYMEDANKNSCDYDFKNIRFRRTRVTDITPNTTVDSKSKGTYGVYRTYCTEGDTNNVGDTRKWLGSGAECEKNLINHIFDGTFRNIEWGQTAYSDAFMNSFVKPFANLTDPSKSYLGFWTNTITKPTWFAYKDNDTTKGSYYKANFTETSEYVWRYTFDLNGEDYSNNVNCHDNHLTGYNSTILVFDDTTNITYNTIDRFRNNTILLIPGIKSSTGITKCGCELFLSNLIIADYISNLSCKQFNYNLCLRFDANGITSNVGVYYNILVGGFSGCDFKECSHNLLFGDPRTVQLTGSDDVVSTSDGNYWYDDVSDHWFGYNIMAPFQYGHFFPHTNTNTVLMPYNKGVIFNGTILCNFFYNLKWGVKLEYGSCQSQMFSGAVMTSTIAANAFSNASTTTRVDENNPIPTLGGTDIHFWYADRQTAVANLTDAQKAILADRSIKCMWVTAGNTNKIVKYSDL